MVKSIIGKIKSIAKKDNDSAEFVKIKKVETVDNVVDDFFSEIDNGGAANE